MRKIQDLNGPWRFQPDPYGEGDHEGFERPDWDDSQWFDVDVPCDFSTVLPDLDFYEGGGWYRRSLDVPECMRGRCNLLRFEGVNHRCRVWLNGQLVGEHFDAYLPFEIRVDDSIEYGARNSLVVYADNTCHAEDVPGEQRGWRTFGGLVRSVALVSMSRLHLSHIATDARADGTLNLQADVTNELNELASTAIDVRLKPRIARTGADVPLRAGESGPEIEGGGGAWISRRDLPPTFGRPPLFRTSKPGRLTHQRSTTSPSPFRTRETSLTPGPSRSVFEPSRHVPDNSS